MKRFAYFLAFIFINSLSAAWHVEYIKELNSDITVNVDGSVDVRETITYVNLSLSNKHGILRTFPTRYTGTAGTNYTIRFALKQVLRNGNSEPYTVEHGYTGDYIRIGDANVVLPPSIYTYTVAYHTERQLGFFDEYDALYWNIVGNGVTMLIEKVTAQVHLPTTIPSNSITVVGSTGAFLEEKQNYKSSIDGHTIKLQTTKPLQPYEAFTVKVAWAKGYVHAPTAWENFIDFARDNIGIVLMLFACIFSIVWYLFWWRKRRVYEDKEGGPIIPLFYPPTDMSPGAVHYFLHTYYDARQFAAEAVAMSVKGLITIDYKKAWWQGTYTLTKKRDATADDIPLHKEMMKKLFSTKNSVELTQENRSLLKSVSATMEHHYAHYQKFFVSNYNLHLLPMLLYGASLLALWLNGYGFIIVIALFLFFAISAIGFYLTRTYTPEGCKLLHQILGFKLFLATTETERLKVIGTPPTKTPELYEKYLPYAIALGVEEQWSQQFAPVFAQLEKEGRPYRPIWYHGPSLTTFNAQAFSSQISNSLQSAASSSGGGSGGRSSSSAGGGRGGGGISSW